MYISAHPLDKFRLEIDEFTNADIAKVNEAESRMAVDKSYRDKVFFVAGIVTATESGISKTNKPWSSFTIEDFSGQHSFRLFGKDHENFMKYTTLHNHLFIKCATVKRFRGKNADPNEEEEYTLRLQSVTLLGNTRDDFITEMHIGFPLERCDAAFRKKLLAVLKRHKGETRLYFDIHYRFNETEDQVSMFSKKYLVKPSYALYDELDALAISHRIVKKDSTKWFQ